MAYLPSRALLASALLLASCTQSEKGVPARPADKTATIGTAATNGAAPVILSSEPCLSASEATAVAAAGLPGEQGRRDPHAGPPGEQGGNARHEAHGEPGGHGPRTAPSPQEMAGLDASAKEGRCRRIRYRSDGLSVVGFVLEPPRATPLPAPAILVARGGNRGLGKIDPPFLARLNELAAQGFVVVATQYRGVDGGEGKEEFGGADLADYENLVAVARELPSVDRENLFALGYSRGGMMVAMALRRKMPVRAAAFYSGAFDLEQLAELRPEMAENFRDLIPGYEEHKTEELRRRSAVYWADEITTPALILGGERDPRTPFDANGKRLSGLLAKAGREQKLIAYDDDHALGKHRGETLREIVDWFRAHAAPRR
jgi:dienelactone hydrolase